MNQAFAFVTHNGIRLLVYLPWWREGIVHGMTLRELSFGGEASPASVAEFSEAIGVHGLVTPKQTHSDLFYDLRSADVISALLAERGSLIRFAECDALLCSDQMPKAQQRLAFGVATADCVPVIVRGKASWAVVHAGWRGLANGIISRVLEAMDEPVEAAIFAAAGGAVYEVGGEVIEAIGPSAVARETESKKFLLDTAETAKNQLRQFIPEDKIVTSGLCTITDQRFHSYRRDGDAAGRSFTCIVPL